MSEHQVRDRIFKKCINCEQNYLGHATSSTKMLNIWSLHHLCHDWPWNSERNWGKLHFLLIALSLPSFSFTYWSGRSAKRSNLSSARHGLPRSCPAFCWPGAFPFRTTPSRKQLLCPCLRPLPTGAVQGLSRGAGEGKPVCDATWSARIVVVGPTVLFLTEEFCF